MKLRTKILTFLVAVMCIIPLFAACKDQTENSTMDTTDKGVVTSSEVDVLPELDYGGKNINVYTWSGTTEWVLSEEAKTASAIDYKSYEHITVIEKRLGVKYVIARTESGGWGKHESFITTLNNSVSSGDGSFDLVCQYSLASAVGALSNVYMDLSKFKYFNNFKSDYWSDDLIKSNTIGGKIYYVTGDMSGSVVKNMGFLTYNKDLSAAYDLGNLYQLVRDGKWTLETFRTLIADIYDDSNNNEKRDTEDFYGLVVPENNFVDFYQYGSDLRCITFDENGDWQLNPEFLSTGEKAIDVCTTLRNLIDHTMGVYFAYPTADKTLFVNGRTIFQNSISTDIITSISQSNIIYGILPMPKFDENQDNYNTALSMVYSMFSIPKDATNPEMVSAVMEAMGSNGYTFLTPYIFENALKSRYAEEPADAEMLDIIRSGIIYEPGRIFTTIDCFSLVRGSVQYDREWAAFYEERGSNYQTILESIMFELG